MVSMEVKRLGRREFIGAAAAALFSCTVITVTGCSDDSASGPSESTEGKTGSIEGNHGHAVVITKAEITAQNAVVLTLTGAGHIHTLDLTAEDVKTLNGGGQLHGKVTSVSEGHTHAVHFF